MKIKKLHLLDYLSLNKKKILFFLFIFFLIFLFFLITAFLALNFNSREFLYKIEKKVFYNQISFIRFFDNLLNQVDFVRSIKRFSTSKNADIIDIQLSPLDLEYFKTQREKMLIKKWIPNDDKEWRKAKIILNGSKADIKIKIHGGSTTSIKDNRFSFKIRHDKEGPYLGLWRQYNLLNYSDPWGKVSTIAINNLAENFGLIVSPQKTVILKINGVFYDFFRIEESFNKNYFFERNYQLPNFTVIKTSDDFDRMFSGEVSNLELDERFYMVDGGVSEDLNEVAMGALRSLLTAIKNKDTLKIKQLIDLDYYAKYFAFVSLYNYAEYGSDMKLVFDHDLGKFKILFRAEEIYIQEYSPVNYLPEFNIKLIEEIKSGTFEIFKILLLDNSFVQKRDGYLLNIINKKEEFLKIINETYSKNENNTIFSNEPRSREKYLKTKTIKTFQNNINIIDEYLNYGKFYISIESSPNKKNLTYSILTDSFIDHYIEGYYTKNNLYVELPNKVFLKRIDDFFQIKLGTYYNYNSEKISINEENFKNFRIINSLTKKETDFKNQSFVKLRSTDKDINFEQVLKKNNIKYVLNKNNINLLEGSYLLVDDLIFPEDLNIYINPGVNLTIEKNINILIRGSFIANGEQNRIIIIKSKDENSKELAFGSVIIIGDKLDREVKLNYFKITGGNQTNLGFIKTTGQIHINNFKIVEINNSYFMHSYSDDGLNIKNSNVKILNSIFSDNSSDQLDCDNCSGYLIGNLFTPNNNSANSNGDGLDVSFSKLIIEKNIFQKNLDKGISVGENSDVKILNNKIISNNIGIAVKDGAKAFLENNYFLNNKKRLEQYNKKLHYSNPSIVEK